MSNADLVDHRRLELLTGGDAALRAEIADLFVTEATRHVTNAQSAAAASDPAALARVAHVLGGAASNIGATRLGALAQQAEVRAKAGEVPRELVTEIERVFVETRVELGRFRTS